MKIIQVLETDKECFKKGNLVRVKYNVYDDTDDYNFLETKEIVGKIKSFSSSDRIILDISKEYESESITLMLYDIISIEMF